MTTDPKKVIDYFQGLGTCLASAVQSMEVVALVNNDEEIMQLLDQIHPAMARKDMSNAYALFLKIAEIYCRRHPEGFVHICRRKQQLDTESYGSITTKFGTFTKQEYQT